LDTPALLKEDVKSGFGRGESGDAGLMLAKSSRESCRKITSPAGEVVHWPDLDYGRPPLLFVAPRKVHRSSGSIKNGA